MAATVTQLVDCGTFNILAINRLTAALNKIISATCGVKSSFATSPELSVFATRPPRANAPRTTKTENNIAAFSREIKFAP